MTDSNIVQFQDHVGPAIISSFEVAYRPAKVTLDELAQLRPALQWLEAKRRSRRSRLTDPDRASAAIEVIPNGSRLADTGALILRALGEETAPDSRLQLVVGLELAAEPDGTATDARRDAIVDTLTDPEVGGFSPPILVRALRESRRTHDRLTASNLLRICRKQCDLLRAMHADIDELAEARYEAEDYLEARGLLKLTYDIDDEEDPTPCLPPE